VDRTRFQPSWSLSPSATSRSLLRQNTGVPEGTKVNLKYTSSMLDDAKRCCIRVVNNFRASRVMYALPATTSVSFQRVNYWRIED
jgi:hypothetical protein